MPTDTAPTALPAPVVPRKLIEVALPLEAINAASSREKSIRHGHPSTMHLWWARRPLAAARAVIFAQIVHDPEDLWRHQHPGEEPSPQQRGGFKQARAHLFKLLEKLVQWENSNKEEVLAPARAAIRKAWSELCALNPGHPDFDPRRMPGLHDPFAGGGAIPLEAQRLGLDAFASDLNPVPVLLNKAMIEIPPRFAGKPPVGPAPRDAQVQLPKSKANWSRAEGLAEDVRRYGAWMRAEAHARIGHLYPNVTVTAELARGRDDLATLVGKELPVIAWLWARTVPSPHPAFAHVQVPLVSTFVLSSKDGKAAWVEPVVEGDTYRFEVRTGPKAPESAGGGTIDRRGARCLVSHVAMPFPYLRDAAKAGKFGTRLLAIVAEGPRGRVYLPPSAQAEVQVPATAEDRHAEIPICHWPGRTNVVEYGMTKFLDLFTPRQLHALGTFADLVDEARARVRADAIAAGLPDDDVPLEQGGTGARAYAEAVRTYLAFAVDRLADYNSSIATWKASGEQVMQTFKRQAIPMTWDFPESNVLGVSAICWRNAVAYVADALHMTASTEAAGKAVQANACIQKHTMGRFVSTDPPYYDNIGYADLSDFFYVWLRRCLRDTYPALLAGLTVPKAEELVATPYRHGSKEKAETFFLEGMTTAMRGLAEQSHPGAPVTIYYAFKQSETGTEGTSNTGWSTFLEAVLTAGFQVTGTWPVRTELANRVVGMDTNALASSVVLVCRKRPANARTTTRRAFLRELHAVLAQAREQMVHGAEPDADTPTPGTPDRPPRATEVHAAPVSPVDLAQALIGPGMGVYSRYAAVLEADGTRMPVRDALLHISRFLSGGDLDADTMFCLAWFEQRHWDAGPFGEADGLARAMATSVDGLAQAGVLTSGGGAVQLVHPDAYPAGWDPSADLRLPAWEALHHLSRVLLHDGEQAAGRLLRRIGDRADDVRALAFRLYTLCEGQGRAEDGRRYNGLVMAWEGIQRAADAGQTTMFSGGAAAHGGAR